MAEAENSAWGQDDGATATVLQAVLRHAAPRELRNAAAVCRAWRRAAAADALWRRALAPRAAPEALRALRRAWGHNRHIASWRVWNWRREGALVATRWKPCAELPHAAGSALLHAALDRSGTALAMLAEHAKLSVWERNGEQGDSDWGEVWSGCVSDEWGAAGAVEWAPQRRRLLVAGPLLLADRWEIVVIDFTEDWRGQVVCRASSSAGTWPTWLDEAHFITLHARLAAPHCATTTVCINSTTQGLHSEHAGVVAPLLRIYNEAGATVTHTLVVDCAASPAVEQSNESPAACSEPLACYYRCLQEKCASKQRALIVGGGSRGGARGEARALLAWQLPAALTVPPVYLKEGLAERLLTRQQRNAEPPAEPPGEEAVRALCSPPSNICVLPAAVLGLTVHPSSGCVWASTAEGVACISLPLLRLVLWLPMGAAGVAPPYRLQPYADHDYVVSPEAGSGAVRVWSVRSGLCNATLPHANLALVALLPPTQPAATSHSLLVLTSEALHIWRSQVPTFAEGFRGVARFISPVRAVRHTMQQRTCHGALQESCAPRERPPCPPCESPAPPPCRRAPRDPPRGIRQVCCAPPAARRPPCPPPEPPSTFTCENQLSTKADKQGPLFSRRTDAHQGVQCGAQLDRVAQRLAAAEDRRRQQYEDEASQPLRVPQASSPAPYSLTGQRYCARATDGRDYICRQEAASARTCVDGGAPPPVPVDIMSFEACDIQPSRHLDPCAHKPRVFMEIDRTSTIKSPETTSGESRTSEKSTCPRLPIHREKDRCETPPQIVNVPPACREPSLVERLRRGIGPSARPPRRSFHSRPRQTLFYPTMATERFSDISINNKLSTALKGVENLEETTRGRTVGLINSLEPKDSYSGYLKLPIPPNADSVKVLVTLEVKPPAVTVDSQETPSKCGQRGASDRWLSIKNIQQKLAGTKRGSALKRSEKPSNNSCPVRPARIPANPCAPAPAQPPARPRTPSPGNPCANSDRTRSVSVLHPPHIVIC